MAIIFTELALLQSRVYNVYIKVVTATYCRGLATTQGGFFKLFMLRESLLFVKAVDAIDDYVDSHQNPSIRHDRAQKSLLFLESGSLPPELEIHQTNLDSFRQIYCRLNGTLKNRFEHILTALFNVTEKLRSVSDPAEYARLAKTEANITATLMYMFISESDQLGAPLHLFLQTAGRILNKADNILDLKKDYREGTAQVPPTILNTLIILFT